MTKAELKRRLVPGTELTLVNCLLGPCSKPRTVCEVRSRDYVMLTPEGTHSYLMITPDEEIHETANGFAVVLKQDNKIAAEYVWGFKQEESHVQSQFGN